MTLTEFINSLPQEMFAEKRPLTTVPSMAGTALFLTALTGSRNVPVIPPRVKGKPQRAQSGENPVE